MCYPSDLTNHPSAVFPENKRTMEPHETQQVAPDAGAVSVYAEPTPEQLKALLKQLESKLLSVEAENRVLKQVVAEKNYKIEALKKESQTSKKSIVEDKSALASQVFNHGYAV
ncbi:hypothetical protein BCR33DRAFT_720387, partial [Rhizoclosmatium globosum]